MALLRFEEAAGNVERFHCRFDLAGGDSVGAGLHHHGLEGLVDPAARLEPAGEEAALLQFGNSQGEIRLLGDEYAPARMKPSTDGYRDLGLQQMLEAPANDPRNQGARRRAEPARRTNYGQGSWPAVGLVAVLRTGPQTS